MSKSGRQANFELLRIVAMFMVVVMHYLANTIEPAADGASRISGPDVVYVVLESLCIVAVNVYVLISGYFLSETAFSWKRPVRVIAQTLFYTVLIPLILAVFGALSFSEVFNIYHIWNCIFPVQSGHYWFVTAYVVLMLFTPVLNAAVQKLEKRQFLQVLAALLLFFCIGKTISPLQFATDRYGYDFGWFMVLYLIGGYIRRYGSGFLKNAGRGWAVYLGSAAGIAAVEFLLMFLCQKGVGLVYYRSVPFHYNFLFCLTGALGLFSAFLHMEMKEGKAAGMIRFISPAVFGVYLIHEQTDVAGRWFGWVNGLTGKIGAGFAQQMADGRAVTPVGRYLLLLALQTLIVFIVCIVIDKVRGFFVSRIKKL
ncbi:MAG: acyltransferase [Eubacteriales bacterium]|nr:acyltransferase [Eubacteriales bacterium]